MFSLTFFKAAGERALRAFAFSLTAFVGVSGIGFGDVDWIRALSVSGIAAILSILTSITVNSATGTGPAITDSEQTVAKDEVVVSADAL